MKRNDEYISKLVAGAMRNPRVDPAPGDKLSKDGYTRTVEFVSSQGATRKVRYAEVANMYGEKWEWASMTNWRAWARRATVLEVAK